MRNFETDFDFNFEEGTRCRRARGFRIDEIKTLVFGGKRVFTPEREEIVQGHRRRVETEKHERALPLSSLK